MKRKVHEFLSVFSSVKVYFSFLFVNIFCFDSVVLSDIVVVSLFVRSLTTELDRLEHELDRNHHQWSQQNEVEAEDTEVRSACLVRPRECHRVPVRHLDGRCEEVILRENDLLRGDFIIRLTNENPMITPSKTGEISFQQISQNGCTVGI